jgi:hypothetical protein
VLAETSSEVVARSNGGKALDDARVEREDGGRAATL